MRLCAAIALTLLCSLLTACGSSTTTTITTSGAASPGTDSSTTSTAAPASSSTTTTTSTNAGPPACVAADLALRFLGQQGATGHGLLGFALENTSGNSCKTFGYPGIQFLGKSGQPLPTVPVHTTHDFFGAAPAVGLIVAPGKTVSFRLGVTHGAVPNEPCATAYALQVIAPDDTATIHTPLGDGAYECRTTTVSPLRPGTSAYP